MPNDDDASDDDASDDDGWHDDDAGDDNANLNADDTGGAGAEQKWPKGNLNGGCCG